MVLSVPDLYMAYDTFLFGIVLMLIVFAASWMIWMPFFKIYDKQVCEEEAAEQK